MLSIVMRLKEIEQMENMTTDGIQYYNSEYEDKQSRIETKT